MINRLSFAAPVNRNSVSFKAVEMPNKKKYPKIHEAWQLARTEEVKDAIALTVKKKVEHWELRNVTHYLNLECSRLDENEKTALKMAINAQEEWQISNENKYREYLLHFMDVTSKGKRV